MSRRSLTRFLLLSFLAVSLLGCSADYSWHNDVPGFVDDGLSAVLVHNVDIRVANLSALNVFVPGEINTVEITMLNPRNLDVTYAITAQPPADCFSNAPTLTPNADKKHLTLTFTTTMAARNQDMAFEISVDVPTISRDFDSIKINKKCNYPNSQVDIKIYLPGEGNTTLAFNPASLSVEVGTAVPIATDPASPLAAVPMGAWLWYVNGTQQYGAPSPTFSPDTSQAGSYRITATCLFNEVLYSGDCLLTVTEPVYYTVSFDLDGGTGIPGSSLLVQARKDDSTVTPPLPTKAGFEFMGWHSDDLSASSQTLSENSSFFMPAHNVTFKAEWRQTFDPVGNLQAYPDNSMVRLTWEEPSNTTPNRIVITWKPSSPAGAPTHTMIIPAGVMSAAIQGLANGTNYTFTATAIYQPDGVDQSSPTVSKTATPFDDAVYRTLVDIPVASAPLNQGGAFDSRLSPFSLAKYELTYKYWYEVKTWALTHGYSWPLYTGREGTNGSYEAAPVDAKMPVTTISWRDAIVWCNALSEREGLTPVYYADFICTVPIRISTSIDSIDVKFGKTDNPYVNWQADGYRLPTEAEWEYAARFKNGSTWNDINLPSGADTVSGTGNVSVYQANSGNTASAIGTKNANSLQLYDMSGNVSEWCWDTIAIYPSGVLFNYRSDTVNGISVRAIRGGYYNSQALDIATGAQGSTGPWELNTATGIRLARSGWQNTAPTFDMYAYMLLSQSSRAHVKTFGINPTNGVLTQKDDQDIGSTAGKGVLALNPQGSRLYCGWFSTTTDSSFNFFNIDPETGKPALSSDPDQIFAGYTIQNLLLSTNGDRLYAALSSTEVMVATFKVNSGTGSLAAQDYQSGGTGAPTALVGGHRLVFVSASGTNGLYTSSIDSGTASLATPTPVSGFATTGNPDMLRLGTNLYILNNTVFPSLQGIGQYMLDGNDNISGQVALSMLVGYTRMVATPDGRYIIAGKAGSNLIVYSVNRSTGGLIQVSNMATLSGVSDRINIKVSPDSRFLYYLVDSLSDMENMIDVYAIGSGGNLTKTSHIPYPSGVKPIDIEFSRFARP